MMPWDFPHIWIQGERWLAKTRAQIPDHRAYCEALETEIIRLMENPRDTMSEHPGCVYCMEAGSPVQDGQVCSECGDRNPTEADRFYTKNLYFTPHAAPSEKEKP